jgi:hypothetical protein
VRISGITLFNSGVCSMYEIVGLRGVTRRGICCKYAFESDE